MQSNKPESNQDNVYKTKTGYSMWAWTKRFVNVTSPTITRKLWLCLPELITEPSEFYINTIWSDHEGIEVDADWAPTDCWRPKFCLESGLDLPPPSSFPVLVCDWIIACDGSTVLLICDGSTTDPLRTGCPDDYAWTTLYFLLGGHIGLAAHKN